MSSQRKLGFLISAVLIAAVVFFLLSGQEQQEPEVVQDDAPADVVAAAPLETSDEAESLVSAETVEAPVVAKTASPDEPQPDQEAATEAESDQSREVVSDRGEESADDAAPVLDVVRVEKDGSGLVAGRTTPGATVSIVVDGEDVGTAEAGSDGAFVALIETTPSDTPQEIVARTITSDEEPEVQSEPVLVIASENEDAPIIIAPEADGVRLLQPPTKDVGNGITLDTISYDPAGNVRFSGRTAPKSSVRLYLDDALIIEAPVNDDGSWQAAAPKEVAAGVYELRVDQIGADGTVLARVSTPFLRETIEDVQQSEGSLTVQKGDNLWRIAEQRYGSGTRYTVIVGANAESIRDPDLIYPGQIFSLPEQIRVE